MQKTITFLMFVGEQFCKAEEAIKFYISLFKDSGIQHIDYFKANEQGGKAGAVKLATFTLSGQTYMAIDSGFDHKFAFTPAISIYVNCESEEELESLYKSLSDGGGILMPLGDYGFSKKFGWVADRYGVNWQLNWV
ncbi:VOC family protein [Emticicia sp. C21]|uniref:VOC family protein n=1 Tax=Emticicia sp. C21 TaxID=2302915 RepID=UPI000E35753C|nr:VOC family protein [Emticicia sp. C21]RFS13535.1 VOC family protein [Emticicia sp. C21]